MTTLIMYVNNLSNSHFFQFKHSYQSPVFNPSPLLPSQYSPHHDVLVFTLLYNPLIKAIYSQMNIDQSWETCFFTSSHGVFLTFFTGPETVPEDGNNFLSIDSARLQCCSRAVSDKCRDICIKVSIAGDVDNYPCCSYTKSISLSLSRPHSSFRSVFEEVSGIKTQAKTMTAI